MPIKVSLLSLILSMRFFGGAIEKKLEINLFIKANFFVKDKHFFKYQNLISTVDQKTHWV